MFRIIITLILSGLGLLLVVPVVALLVPVWLFCVLVNTLAGLIGRRGAAWSEIMQFEPEIGWKPRGNLDTVYIDRVGDSCTIKTDVDGWPGSGTIEGSDVVVLGDSFAFGYGSIIQKTYYALTKACRIKPIGAPGYNMVQELLLLKRYSSRLRGKVVVWFACIENDLAENLKAYNPRLYTNPFLRKRDDDSDWEVVSEHVRPDAWPHGDGGISNRVLFAHICTKSPYSDRIFSATEYLIRKGREICAGAGADLVIFSIPYKDQLTRAGRRKLKSPLPNPAMFDPAYPERRLAEICEGLAVPFIKGSDCLSLRDYKVRDGHWSFRGNRKVGRIIENTFHERRPRESERDGFPTPLSPLPRPL